MRQQNLSFLLCLLFSLMSGCASYTHEIQGRFEVYISPDQDSFDGLYDMVQKQILYDMNEQFVRRPIDGESHPAFCTMEEEAESKNILQCAVLIPYYAANYCDDMQAMINNVFLTIEAQPVILDDSLNTCYLGEYSNSPGGGKAGFILAFGADLKREYIDWTTFKQNLARAFYKGNCYLPSDIAADGSRCGGRAATARPGGKN
ncbi:MAG: hypothetical protein CML22_07125 [Rheinheimera sp.]|nr:hypothetical protein [Rheinheimera sp.]